jgi:hypothetical protein
VQDQLETLARRRLVLAEFGLEQFVTPNKSSYPQRFGTATPRITVYRD